MGKIYLTGDVHRDFRNIYNFCKENETTTDDILVVLGDVGINYFLDEPEQEFKANIAKEIGITLACVHGNHEERPANVPGYELVDWHGAKAYIDPRYYPNQVFLKDGEIYNLNGKKVLVIGGAYSVDKEYRLKHANQGYKWFESEQPSPEIKEHVIENLDKVGWKVDYVFAHTCPYDQMPRHCFLPTVDQRKVDNSTEIWMMEEISKKLDFKRWYYGHFHDEYERGKYTMLYHSIIEFE